MTYEPDEDKTYAFMARADTRWTPENIASRAVGMHIYDSRDRTESKPDDPGWHPCRCGKWEGYWSSFHEHVGEDVMKALAAYLRRIQSEAFELGFSEGVHHATTVHQFPQDPTQWSIPVDPFKEQP